MTLHLINNSDHRMPREWIHQWTNRLQRELGPGYRWLSRSEMAIVFLNVPAAKKMNQQFRKRKYATDILSFQSEDPATNLGELVLCPQVLKRQAREHGHSFRAELGYMLIHGVLHLLGYEHEGRTQKARQRARKMFELQDQIFDSLRVKLHL